MRHMKGTVEYTFSVFLLMYVTLMAVYLFRMELLQMTRVRVEDSMVAANLAAAVLNLELYEDASLAVISDVEDAYGRYLRALRENLRLNEEMKPTGDRLLKSDVQVESFEIYNVYGDDVEKIRVLEEGLFLKDYIAHGMGTVETPDGKIVENTTIYSCIGFEVAGFGKGTTYVTKENSVDIVAEPVELPGALEESEEAETGEYENTEQEEGETKG